MKLRDKEISKGNGKSMSIKVKVYKNKKSRQLQNIRKTIAHLK